MAKAVLDASALLAFINDEPGGEQVAGVIGDAIMSAVNFAEVVTKLIRSGVTLELVLSLPAIAELEVVAFDRGLAKETGMFAARPGARALSLGDRACIALAAREGWPRYRD
jgi:ribonuclease VapC